MSPKPFAEQSGVVGRFTIDPKSAASVSGALSELLKLYQGENYENGQVTFSVDNSNGTSVTPLFSFLNESSRSRYALMSEMQAFLRQVAGFAGDATAKTIYGATGLPLKMESSASLQQLALGMQKMHGALSRQQAQGPAV